MLRAIAVSALLMLPALLMLANRAAESVSLMVFLLYTRVTDLSVHLHGVSAVAPKGLSAVAQLSLAVTAAILFIRRSRAGRSSTLATHPAVCAAFAFLLAVYCASSVWAQDERGAATGALSLAKNLVIVYVVAEALLDRRGRRLVLWSLVAAGVAMSGLTLFQTATHTYSHTFLGLSQAPVRGLGSGTSVGHRAAGPVGDPNFYALVLAMVIPVAMIRVWAESRVWLRLVAAGSALLISIAVVLTYSRGAWVALALVVVLLAPVMRIPGRWVVGALVVAALLSPLVPASISGRVSSLASGDASNAHRLQSDVIALAMFGDHPIGGVGVGNYPARFPAYAERLNAPGAADRPHDQYLETAAETGALGLGAFVLGIVLVFGTLRNRRRSAISTGDRDAEASVASCIAALAVYFVGAAFLPIAYPRYLWLVVGIALGLTNLRAPDTKSAAVEGRAPARRA